MDENQNLQRQIDELKRRLDALNQYQTITLPTELAFIGRGFLNTYPPELPDVTGDYTANVGFRRTISLSGAAEDIIVPAYPIRFIKLKDGSNLYIPLYTYAEFGP